MSRGILLAVALGAIIQGCKPLKPTPVPPLPATALTIAVPVTGTTVSGLVAVRGDAQSGVTGVRLLVDGVSAGTGGVKDEAYSLVWDSSLAATGDHVLAVEGSDASGNTVTTTVHVAIRTSFDVKSFGAKGDGATDDTPALSSALAAASGGGTVYLPAGTYLVDPTHVTLNLASDMEIRGDGPQSVLKVKDDAGSYNTIFGATSTLERVAMRHLRVDQNPSGNTTADVSGTDDAENVIRLGTFTFTNDGFSDIEIEDVRFDAQPGVQAICLSAKGASGVTIDGCAFRFARGHTQDPAYDASTVFTEAANVLVRANTFVSENDQNAITAIEVHGGPGVLVERNDVDQFETCVNLCNAEAGFPDVPADFIVKRNRFTHAAGGVQLWSITGRSLRRVSIEDNTFAFSEHKLYSKSWWGTTFVNSDPDSKGDFADIKITGNTLDFSPLKPVSGASLGTSFAAGIDIEPPGDLDGLLVEDNQIIACPGTGIAVTGSSRMIQSVTVTENVIEDAGWDVSLGGALRAAVYVNSVSLSELHVDANSIRDTGARGSPNGLYSLWMHPGSANRVTAVDDSIEPHGALLFDVDPRIDTTATTP